MNPIKAVYRVMNRHLKIVIIISLFFTSSLAYAVANRPVIDSKDVRGNREIIQGVEYLYDWKFDKANDLFRKMILEKPSDPTGYFYLSMVTWCRMAAGFWSADTVEEYIYNIEKTISVAKERIKKGDVDSFTYFYLGGALGYKGRFLLMQQNFFSSYLVSREAIEALNTCLKMDPDNRDVLLGLGIYDYYTARLSGVLKFLTYIFLHRGDKEEGLRKLHVAAEEAIYSSIEAKSMLLHIYLFLESDFQKGLPFAEELAERFKSCPKHAYLLGLTYIRLGMDDNYLRVLERFHEASRKSTSAPTASMWESWGRYLEASYQLFHDHYDEVKVLLNDILLNRDPENNPYMIAWPLMKLGMTYDLEGKRGRALEYYNRVLELINGAGAQFMAQKYIDKAAQKGDPLLGL